MIGVRRVLERKSSGPMIANFDRVARVYRWAEYLALGPLLRRTREYLLPRCAEAGNALALGDGDGRFAAALLRQAPHLHLRAVDSSRAMLQLLGQRCDRDGNRGRVSLEYGVAPGVDLQAGCDLIATHFFLDCLTQGEVETLARRFAEQAGPGCRWVLSDFGVPCGRIAGWVAKAYLRLLYLAFRLLTQLPVQALPQPQTALAAAGFQRLIRREWMDGFLYTEMWVLKVDRQGGSSGFPQTEGDDGSATLGSPRSSTYG